MPHTIVAAPPKPAKTLLGRELPNGWKVVELLPSRGEAGAGSKTGGVFSVGYIVERGGERAFMKVFDIGGAMLAPNFVEELQRITTQYTHEKALLDLCQTVRMSRIIKTLDSGSLTVETPETGSFKIPLSYLIFERADGDIREMLSKLGAVEDVWRLQHLQHVAIGLAQLHSQKVAHQDIKPSNILVFHDNGEGAKIADLGRASRHGMSADHDTLKIPGDPGYAAPEHLYGHEAPDWVDRREACDLYHLGSLICFLFAGIPATSGIFNNMDKQLWPIPHGPWGGAYKDVLPHLTAAFTKFLQELAPSFPEWAGNELLQIVHDACNPDVYRRGDPSARAQHGRPIGLDRFVSKFDRLAKAASVHARIAGKHANPAGTNVP